jgi:hypothetical protein
MTAKGKRAASTSGRTSSKGKSTSSKQVAASKSQLMRHARVGRRTTLRVPRALDTEVARTAKELDISENEALIRLAQLGAITTKRHRDVRRVVGQRQAAVAGAGAKTENGPLPSPEEMQAAILVDRN